jgi:RNA polymerase sigma factor (sigma-70 family)
LTYSLPFSLHVITPGQVIFSDVQLAGIAIPLAETEDDSFERLILLHERQVARTALRLLGRADEAQDATQEVLLRLFRNMSKLRRDSNVGAWLYRVTVNVCRDTLRRRTPFTGFDRDYASTAPGPEFETGLSQRKRLVLSAMTRLTERERECITLHDIEGLSTREATVRSHLSSARARLKELLQ